jgi:NADH-quinone oxidoreductase subunit I
MISGQSPVGGRQAAGQSYGPRAPTKSVILLATAHCPLPTIYMIRPFLVGFATTLRHMFKKPVTVNYPDQKVPMFPKYRGKQVLMRDENGLEKCVACGLCAVACPADAIYLEAAENDGTVMAGPRYAKLYQIHKTRCIFCGYCEEACPVSAIFMGKDYELAVYSKKDFIWDKTDLLVPLPSPRR